MICTSAASGGCRITSASVGSGTGTRGTYQPPGRYSRAATTPNALYIRRAMTGERAIVVEHRKELTYLLCQAAELEHALMAQYLFAAFSLRSEPGPGLTEDQLEAVERWRSVILAISAEEMLHWALVQNLLIAVGSAPYVSRPHMPHQAKGYPPGIQLRLLPFNEASLRHFVYLERPEGMDMSDGAGFVPTGPALEPMAPDELQPRGQNFTTQGYLYRAIED